jgi:hypothetical protein
MLSQPTSYQPLIVCFSLRLISFVPAVSNYSAPHYNTVAHDHQRDATSLSSLQHVGSTIIHAYINTPYLSFTFPFRCHVEMKLSVSKNTIFEAMYIHAFGYLIFVVVFPRMTKWQPRMYSLWSTCSQQILVLAINMSLNISNQALKMVGLDSSP